MRFGANAPVEDQTLSSSKAKPGISIGIEPVAITASSKVSVLVVPSLSLTEIVFLSTKLAEPISTSTLWLLSRIPTPPVSLATTLCFHSTSFARSSLTSVAVMPMALAAPIRCSSEPAAIMAFEGMQPTLRQQPPRNSFSTTVTCCPSWARRMAQT